MKEIGVVSERYYYFGTAITGNVLATRHCAR
jgi:hypothetical protein